MSTPVAGASPQFFLIVAPFRVALCSPLAPPRCLLHPPKDFSWRRAVPVRPAPACKPDKFLPILLLLGNQPSWAKVCLILFQLYCNSYSNSKMLSDLCHTVVKTNYAYTCYQLQLPGVKLTLTLPSSPFRLSLLNSKSTFFQPFNPFTPELKKCILPTFQKAIV